MICDWFSHQAPFFQVLNEKPDSELRAKGALSVVDASRRPPKVACTTVGGIASDMAPKAVAQTQILG